MLAGKPESQDESGLRPHAASIPAVTEVVATTSEFDERIATREAKVGIVGLGYAGLPLAMSFAEAGFDVTGIDLNESACPRDRRAALIPRGRPF